MVLEAKQVTLLSRLVPLLRIHGYVWENTTVLNGRRWPVYNYGTPGTHLRTNLQQEWWDYMVVKQKNTFPMTSAVVSPSLLTDHELSEKEGSSINLTAFRKSLKSDLMSYFPLTLQLMGGKLPFSTAQIGLRYSENYDDKWEEKLLFGSLFHTEMISHYYCLPVASSQAFDNWLSFRLRWWKQFCRNPSNLVTVDSGNQDNGKISSNIEYKFPWGQEVVEYVTNEGDNPVREKQNEIKTNLCVKSGRKDVLPNLIESRMNLESAMAVYLIDAFQEKQSMTSTPKSGKEKQPRQILHLHRHLAPYKIAIAVTGIKSRELKLVSSRWCNELQDSSLLTLDLTDANTTMEMQFARNDALGIPYTVILNDKTLDSGIVSLRDRDTGLREQVHLTKTKDFIIRSIKPL